MMSKNGIAKLEADGLSLIQSARQFQVCDAGTYREAGDIVLRLTRFIRVWDDFMKPIVEAADTALKTARGQRDKIRGPALEAKQAIGANMEGWDRAERDRIRREQERLAAEAVEQAKVEALLAAEQQGDEAAVAAIARDDASPTMLAFVPPAPVSIPKVEGISYQVTWKAEVVDLAALVQAVAAARAPLKTLKADEVVLNGMARALKEALNLPGVRSVATRGQRTRNDWARP